MKSLRILQRQFTRFVTGLSLCFVAGCASPRFLEKAIEDYYFPELATQEQPHDSQVTDPVANLRREHPANRIASRSSAPKTPTPKSKIETVAHVSDIPITSDSPLAGLKAVIQSDNETETLPSSNAPASYPTTNHVAPFTEQILPSETSHSDKSTTAQQNLETHDITERDYALPNEPVKKEPAFRFGYEIKSGRTSTETSHSTPIVNPIRHSNEKTVRTEKPETVSDVPPQLEHETPILPASLETSRNDMLLKTAQPAVSWEPSESKFAEKKRTILPTGKKENAQPPEEKYVSGDWLKQQEKAIATLEEEIRLAKANAARRNEVPRLETLLRLQHALAGRRDAASQAIEGLPSSEQEFWKHETFALVDLLATDRLASESRRYAVALQSLEEAQRNLASAGTLSLKNLTFCRKVQDFGQLEKFERSDFTKNQEVLLYVEVRNFAAVQANGQYETELQGSFRVLDKTGTARSERTLPLDKQTCANHRRDYYIAYRIYVPAELAPGTYSLELTVEDKKGNKSSNALLSFNVIP